MWFRRDHTKSRLSHSRLHQSHRNAQFQIEGCTRLLVSQGYKFGGTSNRCYQIASAAEHKHFSGSSIEKGTFFSFTASWFMTACRKPRDRCTSKITGRPSTASPTTKMLLVWSSSDGAWTGFGMAPFSNS